MNSKAKQYLCVFSFILTHENAFWAQIILLCFFMQFFSFSILHSDDSTLVWNSSLRIILEKRRRNSAVNYIQRIFIKSIERHHLDSHLMTIETKNCLKNIRNFFHFCSFSNKMCTSLHFSSVFKSNTIIWHSFDSIFFFTLFKMRLDQMIRIWNTYAVSVHTLIN